MHVADDHGQLRGLPGPPPQVLRSLTRHHQPLLPGPVHPGEAVQVDPIKPKLKAPGTKRLKLEYDTLLLSFAFNFNLRRYTLAPAQLKLVVDSIVWAFRQGHHYSRRAPLP